ncbi:uncharacterized protein LODBEIA_P06910 [Lodderomyces beijingensis]|uniref:Uncharacterized protein n=1 Tax=Lodderomyces beijingensis TaxID=1775926 RepID=A0ABP0ZJY9_9ASCO
MMKPNRAETFKAKFLLSHGNNSRYYEVLKCYKEDWMQSSYIVDESLVKRYSKFSKRQLNASSDGCELKLEEMRVKMADENYVNFRFNSGLPLQVIAPEGDARLELQSRLPARLQDVSSGRNVSAIAAGGHITSMQWLPQDDVDEDTTDSYLAVSIVNSPKLPHGLTATSKEISVFEDRSSGLIDSAVQIWKFNTLSNEVSLEKMVLTSSHGTPFDLQWSLVAPQNKESNTVLGVLGVVFNDGTVQILKITRDLPMYSLLEKSSLSFRSSDETSSDITCFAFLGVDKLLAGTASGYLMEFKLDSPNHHSSSSSPLPSYKMFVSDGPISTIVPVETSSGESMVLVNGQAIRGSAFSDTNPIQDVYAPLLEKSNVKPSYNYIMQDLIIAHNVELAKIVGLRSLQDNGSEILRVSGYITTFKLSERLGHPFMLTGTASGDVILMNYARKYFTRRGGNKSLSPLKIWKLQWNNPKEAVLTLDARYEKIEVESPVSASVMPKEVMISSLAWNENVNGSSIYAAGTASGLLLVERLDPSFNVNSDLN